MKFKYLVDLKISVENEKPLTFQYGGNTRGLVPGLISSLKAIIKKIAKEILNEIKKDITILDDPKTYKEVKEMFGLEEEFLEQEMIKSKKEEGR